ncbi:hypothetical protein J5277_16450 [Rhizobium sp. 16-449-1b]|uniref:hypothetical protein n=1 Tax=Rhizobium sp. 16-449-1b TaxID=2819989 RepID=UPI001AD9F4C9|nr:hypothetical protein [Rhizobium sp. 16-449-1b]MBO9195698.1 hypothetical protein [Rhizobium sp. 16-449-1b]
MWASLKRNSDQITAIASIAGVIGILLTFWQVWTASDQLRASNEYGIRKDLREVIAAAFDGGLKTECLRDLTICSNEDKDKTKRGVGLVFNFHQSVFGQAKAGGISRAFAKEMSKDFCSWFKSELVRNYWDAQASAKLYDENRIAMRKEWCG